MATPATPSSTPELLAFTAQIVAANTVPADALPAMILAVYDALAHPARQTRDMQPQELAVPIKRSIRLDYLICLEDGAKVKVLKRHLARFGLTPDTDRARWGLPRDYPMVAPGYSARRSALAKQFGLGTALRTVEQSVPAMPEREPNPSDEPTVQVAPEAQHMAASVFANFPGGNVSVETPLAVNDTERPGRKRFAQQLMRSGRRHVV